MTPEISACFRGNKRTPCPAKVSGAARIVLPRSNMKAGKSEMNTPADLIMAAKFI
jgi:hypothetical protein